MKKLRRQMAANTPGYTLAGVAIAVLLVAVSACAGSDNSQVSSGPGDPIVTTPPLAIPPTLLQPGDIAVATTEPAVVPTPAPTSIPAAAAPATSVPTAEVPADTDTTAEQEAATTTPATAVPATAVPATAVPATAVPAATSTATPASTEPAATAAPASPAGATIALGDFEVVNLVTKANQNIAQLAPSGPTMLWFWAPH